MDYEAKLITNGAADQVSIARRFKKFVIKQFKWKQAAQEKSYMQHIHDTTFRVLASVKNQNIYLQDVLEKKLIDIGNKVPHVQCDKEKERLIKKFNVKKARIVEILDETVQWLHSLLKYLNKNAFMVVRKSNQWWRLFGKDQLRKDDEYLEELIDKVLDVKIETSAELLRLRKVFAPCR